MYRIKTDIRQYKCESIDKVEKLIRNWVIRPNDLIYHSDRRDWEPIGEHPSFVKLFGILEEREASEPDTVVTDNHPLLRNGVDLAADSEEVTNITERPDFKDDEEADENDASKSSEEAAAALESRETDVFDAEQIATSLAERDERDEREEREEQHDDADVGDAVDLTAEEGDLDEITNETSDEDDEDDEPLRATLPLNEKPAPPEAPEGVEPPVNDEITVMTDKTLEMMKVEEEPGPEDEEATQVTGRPVSADDEEEEEEERVAEEDGGDEPEHKVIVSAQDVEEEEPDPPKAVGRHNLPEEFFATNEISGPILEESAKVIDDLAAMEDGSDVDAGWDEIDDALDKGGESRPAPLGLRDTDEISEEEAIEAAREHEESGREEIIVDPLDETAIPAADEWDEDVSSIESDETQPEVVEIEDFISDGYKIPLPFPVGPDEKDVAHGLTRSKKSEAAKDAAFPYPEPKKRGEVHQQVYYFSREKPRDLSVPVIAGLIVLFLLIATTIAVC